MQNNAATLTTACMLLCFACNYTFPMHRETANILYANSTHHWDDFLHHGFIADRSQKMASDLEDTLRKIKNSAQDLTRPHGRGPKRALGSRLNEEDLRQYEQLVIMKKYPYLDLKELEYKYSPWSSKNTRQSLGHEFDANFRADINIEPDEGLNVEIINRGLSGFSIPTKLAKSVAVVENKMKLNNINEEKSVDFLKKKSSKRELCSVPSPFKTNVFIGDDRKK